jgi:hypothetical protein
MHYRRWQRHGDPTFVSHEIVFGTVEERFWAKVQRGRGCWEWQAGRNYQGYGQFAIDRGGERWRTEQAHRIAWELTYGPISEDTIICHHCDNPPCCRPDHLFDGTHADNAQDREAKGRGYDIGHGPKARGSRSGMAKLTEPQVLAIRRRYAGGNISQQALAEEYGVHQTKISNIIRRETWTHI